MIDLDFASTQAARFSVLANFPELREGRAELAKTLARISISREHCGAIVDAALENCCFSPTPAELAQLARSLAPEFQAPEPDDCKHCSGGWRTALYLVTWYGKKASFEPITKDQTATLRDRLDTSRQMVYSAVQECTCPAGQRQKELSATRAASIAAKRSQPARRATAKRVSRAEVTALLPGSLELA